MSKKTKPGLIRLSQPVADQTVNVAIDANNMRLSLGFEADPGTVDKNGQNLEFTFEDGGKLVLEGYYNHFASKSLPVMVMENGDELSGEDFLASLREDLLTASGPDAGASSGSGGAGEYADDAGTLIDGIDRLGSLGTIYWDQGIEVPQEYIGNDLLTAAVNPEPPVGPQVSIIPILPGGPGGPNSPVLPGGPGVPTSPGGPGGPGGPGVPTSPGAPHYYLNAQGYNLEIDESFMPGGTNGTATVPAYTMAFLITSNDGLASLGISGTIYTANGGTLTGFSPFKDKNGSINEAHIVDNGDGTYILTLKYTQGQAHAHSEAGKDTADNVDVFEITVNHFCPAKQPALIG